jgi:hypothetical protein
MSNTNGYNTLTKSMNGIITLADGNGTVIEDGTITTGELNTQNISAPDPSANSTIYGSSTSLITIGNVNSTVICESVPTTANEVANKAYVDSVSGGSVTLGGTNVWTAQNTFNNYAPICSTAPSGNTNLANKLYVDTVAGTAGSSLLASNNPWTGTNDFQNNVTLGKSNHSSTIYLKGECFIGDNANHPGKDTKIYGEHIYLQGFTAIDMIGEFYFKNTVPLSILHINTNDASIPKIEFQTNTSNNSIVTSSIVASGGTTLNTGKIQINAGNILIGQDAHTNTVLITGEVQIGDNLNAPAKNTRIYGEELYLQGFTDVNVVSPNTIFRTTSGTQSLQINTSGSGYSYLKFYTYTSNPSIVTGQIFVSGGTDVIDSSMQFNAGYITFGNYDYSTTLYYRALYNYMEANYSRFGKSVDTQFIELNTATSGSASVDFCTNIASFSTKTVSMIASGGTTAGTGTLSLLSGSANFFNITNTASAMNITPGTGLVTLGFKVNSTNYNQTTAFIIVGGGSGTGTGTITHKCGSSVVSNNAENTSLRINPSTAGQMDIVFRANTATPTQASVTMRGESTGTTNDGTLSTFCGKNVVRNSTGNFCAIEQSVGTDTATINFKSSTANDVVSSSIVATGGTATVGAGTLAVNGSILNINNTTTNVLSTTTNILSDSTNLTGANTTIAGDLYLMNGSGSFKMWDNVSTNTFQYLTANVNLSTKDIAWGTMFCTKYSFATAITVTLSQANNFENTNFTIYNGGSANITVQAGSGNRLFGPGLTRGGVLSLTMGSGTARRYRGSVFGATNFLNNINDNGWFVESIS